MENESVGNQIIYGKAEIDGDNIKVNGESLEYDNLLIATGARPHIPDVKGNEYGLTNKDILKIDDIPDKINIIGGGIIACEIANIFSTLGSEVNVIVRSEFLKEIDSDIKKYMLNHILNNVNILEHTDISECGKNKVVLTNGEELEGIPFFATGRVPNSEIAEGFVDINPDKTIKVNEYMQTSRDNVYAAGDVTGGWQLTPVARMEGICAARNMANYPNKISYNSIPQSISLNTEISFVENEKIKDVKTKTITMPSIAGPYSFWKILPGDTGLTKIEFDSENNRIKKINAISPSSVSDVAYLSYLMRIDSPLDKYSEFIEIHPSNDTNYKIIKSLWL